MSIGRGFGINIKDFDTAGKWNIISEWSESDRSLDASELKNLKEVERWNSLHLITWNTLVHSGAKN